MKEVESGLKIAEKKIKDAPKQYEEFKKENEEMNKQNKTLLSKLMSSQRNAAFSPSAKNEFIKLYNNYIKIEEKNIINYNVNINIYLDKLTHSNSILRQKYGKNLRYFPLTKLCYESVPATEMVIRGGSFSAIQKTYQFILCPYSYILQRHVDSARWEYEMDMYIIIYIVQIMDIQIKIHIKK